MKLCLVNIPYLSVYGRINIGHNSSFPLGLGYIAAVARERGHRVQLLDPEAEQISLEQCLVRMREFGPDLIGLSCVTSNFDQACAWAARIKAGIPSWLMLGGVHATALPEKTLADCPALDWVVVGEGEYVIANLCDAIERKQVDLSKIESLVYREKGGFKKTKRAALIQELDRLPHPSRDLVNLAWYKLQPHFERGRRSATILSSRGCPSSCTFCGNITTGRSFRPHSAEYFVNELEMMVRQYQIRHFHIVDDNFAADKDRVVRICREILRRNLSITWFIFGRIDHLQDADLLRLMKKAGCVFILFGIESGNREVLDTLKKNLTLDQIETTCRLCRKAGIQYVNSFIVGSPGETLDTVRDTVRLAIRLKSVMAAFNIMIPFPGTAIFNTYYKQQVEQIRSWGNWCSVGDALPFPYTHTKLTTRELLSVVARAYAQYYLRPGQWLRLAGFARRPRVFWAYLRGAWGLFKASWHWARAK